jgi:hypothetical protein
MVEKMRKFENIHILLWLLKDICWVSMSEIAGIIMIFPTLMLAMWITWKNREFPSELAHNLAICAWICANSVWMIGEFYFEDSLRPIAIVFFIIGIAIIGIYYINWGIKKIRE